MIRTKKILVPESPGPRRGVVNLALAPLEAGPGIIRLRSCYIRASQPKYPARKGRGFIQKSFTLIEMLMVIVIIGILAAMILPVLSKTKEYARSAKCKANLKQLQIAAMNYYYDKGGFPNTSWVSQSYPKWWGDEARRSITNGTLYPYTGWSMKIYLCPSFAMSSVCGSTAPNGTPLDPVSNAVVRSYGMNSRMGSTWQTLTQIQASRTLLFADVSETNRLKDGTQICWLGMRDNNSYAWNGVFKGTLSGIYPTNAIGAFHNGRGNAVFVDGHVETLSWSDTINACSGNW